MNKNLLERSLAVLPLAAAFLFPVLGSANAADLKDPSTYMGGLLDNTLSLESSISLSFRDPDSSGCTYTGSFNAGTFQPTSACNGDEYFHIDFNNPANPIAVPGTSFGDLSTNFATNPPTFQYDTELLETIGQPAFGDILTAVGVAEDFYNPDPPAPQTVAIGLDFVLGAFTNPLAEDFAKIDPMELFIDLDPSGIADNPPLPGSNNYADLLYINRISEARVAETDDQFVFSLGFNGMAGQAPIDLRVDDGFGGGIATEDVNFIYNWQSIVTLQYADGADEWFNRVINNKETLSTTNSIQIAFEPKPVPEPSSVIGLLSVLGAGALVKKKKQS